MTQRRAVGLCLVVLLAVSGCSLLTGNQPPVAIIEALPTRGSAPLQVEFDGSRSFDPNGLLVHYEWALGDGTRMEGPRVSHVYERNGVYLVTLVVSDQFGASDQDRLRIVVGNPPPQAIFTASPISGWPPLSVSFDASASIDPEGDSVANYEWDFGDGKHARGAQATHIYPKAGQFLVQLTITDREKAESTATLAVNVLDFMSVRDLRVGHSPVDSLVRDLDDDGALDIAVANSESNELSLFFGGAAVGMFTEEKRIPVGRRPVALTAGDFDRNGRLDLAVAQLESGSVSLLFNDGSRDFKRRDEILVGRWISAISSTDFNRDGFLDLVVADADVDQVTLLLGDGAGRFELAASFPTGSWPAAFASGDFNGDSRPDLAVANFQGDSVTLLFGDGLGTLRQGDALSVGQGPVALVSADLNGDEIPDLVVANSKGASLSVLLGTGGGRFGTASVIRVGKGVHALTVGDFDQDGFPDLAPANSGNDTVTLLLNDGSGRFTIPLQARDYSVDDNPTSVAAGDFNRDGFLDLVILQFWGDRISILLNQL